MPINTLTLDPKNPAFADALKNCRQGDTGKELLVTFDVIQHGNKFVAEVTGVRYPEMSEEPEEENGEESSTTEAEAMPEEKPMSKGPKVAIILAGGPKK